MSLFPETLESDRLRYEVVHADRLDPFELYEHVRADHPHIDEVTAYVTWDPYDHPKQAVDWIEHCQDEYERGEGVTYALRPTTGDRAGAFAGLAGLHPEWDRRRATMGVWLRKPFWGHGYSGERAATMFELAFDHLDLELVSVSHDPDNERSEQAIRKYIDRFGGRREGTVRNEIVVNGEPRDTARFSLSAREWAANRGADDA